VRIDGMDVSTPRITMSHAAAEAVNLAWPNSRQRRKVSSRQRSSQYRAVIRTYTRHGVDLAAITPGKT